MPLTTNYDQWIKDTHSMIKPRSESLKKIDASIKMRNEMETKKALINWINEQNSKRQDWQKSVRNGKGAVKKLYDELGVLGATPAFKNIGTSMDDQLAKAHMKREMRLAASKLFIGKQIKFKNSFWGITNNKCKAEATKLQRAGNTAKNAALTVQGVGTNIASAANTARGIADNLKTIITTVMGTAEAIPPETHNAIIELVFGATIEEFVFNAAPALGLATSGAKVVMDWAGVANNLYQKSKMEEQTGNVRPGDAAAALQAISDIIDGQIKKQAADGVIRTAAFSAKAASFIADGGTATNAVIGVAESIAILLNTLYDIVSDAKQMSAGNKLIATGQIDIEVFNVCPLLGCYYIAIQDHSTIMNFDIANMGRDNWKQEAERLRYALDPVIRKASDLIKASRIELSGMENAKGVYQSSFLDKLKLAYKSF